eukprot:16186522-Heterocapsa_arctica.AAC.1
MEKKKKPPGKHCWHGVATWKPWRNKKQERPILVKGKTGGICQVDQAAGGGEGNCKKGGSKDRAVQAGPAPRKARSRSGRSAAPAGRQVASAGAQGQPGQPVGRDPAQAQTGAVPAQDQLREIQAGHGGHGQQGKRPAGLQQTLRPGIRTDGDLLRQGGRNQDVLVQTQADPGPGANA